MKISVIIPVYNAEKTLNECIGSLLLSIHQDLEIILVNDGSTDASLAICRDYENRDNRIKVIDKVNGGVSSARNAGLKAATGDYIAFVDSDDYVDEKIYSRLLNASDGGKNDAIFCGYNVIDDKGIHAQDEPELKKALTDKAYYKNFLLIDMPEYVMGVLWRMIIKRELAVKFSFDTDLKLGEDLVYILQIITNAENIAVIDDKLYFYRAGTGKYADISIIGSYFKIADILFKLYKDSGLDEWAHYARFQKFLQAWSIYIYGDKKRKDVKTELKKCERTSRLDSRREMKTYIKLNPNKKQKLLAFLVHNKLYGAARLLIKINKSLNARGKQCL